MKTVYFTDQIDMTDSSVFEAGYYDDMDKQVYLVFKNLTTVSRPFDADKAHSGLNPESWGGLWNTSLKWFDGENFGYGVEFVQREAWSDDAVEDSSGYDPFVLELTLRVPDEVRVATVDTLAAAKNFFNGLLGGSR